MENRFEVLFSFDIKHPLAGSPLSSEISIRPTQNGLKQLKKFGLLFKPNSNGGLILVEKRVESNSSVVTRPIKSLVDFTFIIALHRSELIARTIPYAAGGAKFESNLSNGFGLYFDNVDSDFKLDTSLELASTNSQSSANDMFGILPERFSVPRTGGLNRIICTPIRSDAVALEFTPADPTSTSIDVTLPIGAYQIERMGNGPPIIEKAMVEPEARSALHLGIVRIYKNQTVDYNTPKAYTITFKEQ